MEQLQDVFQPHPVWSLSTPSSLLICDPILHSELRTRQISSKIMRLVFSLFSLSFSTRFLLDTYSRPSSLSLPTGAPSMLPFLKVPYNLTLSFIPCPTKKTQKVLSISWLIWYSNVYCVGSDNYYILFVFIFKIRLSHCRSLGMQE